jgi:spore coat protein U-like protein
MHVIRVTFVTMAAVALAVAFAPMPAFAGTATATMAVTATVTTNCSVTANPLAFGNYSGAALNVSTTVGVTCTNTTPYNVGLSAGAGSGATVTNRLMTLSGGSQTLSYQLLSGSFTGTNWGNTAATNWASGTGTGAAQTLTVYGVVPASQFPTPGSYSDSITVTVSY